MDLLDRLPQPLQWFRGDAGSIVAHLAICFFPTATAARWGTEEWHAPTVAAVLLAGYVVREVWKDRSDTDAMVKDLVGPVAVFISVLAF